MTDKIIELEKQIEQKEETARYLAGGKKGYCWGRKTYADEKRENELDNLRIKLFFMKQEEGNNNATT